MARRTELLTPQFFSLSESANASMGLVTLSGAAGSAIVYTTAFTQSARVFLTAQNSSGTVGSVRITASTNNVQFTIASSSTTDTSVVAWFLIRPS